MCFTGAFLLDWSRIHQYNYSSQYCDNPQLFTYTSHILIMPQGDKVNDIKKH